MNADVVETLKWLAGGGGAVIAAALVSLLAERSSQFQALDPLLKGGVMAAASAALGLGAWAVLTYVPAETLAQLQGPYLAGFLSISAVLGNQLWHALVNRHTRKR